MSDSAWVSESSDEAEIITASDKGLVLVEINTVDVRSISSLGEDAVDEPSEFGVTGCPVYPSSIRSTAWVVITTWHHVVEELVTVANRLDVGTVHGPVDTGNGGIMLRGRAHFVVVRGLVNVDVGVVRSYGEVSAIGTVFSDFNPFLGVKLFMENSIEICGCPDSHTTIVTAHGDVSIGADSNGPSGLRLWMLTHATGLVSLGLSDLIADLGGGNAGSRDWIPLFDLVVITCGVNVSIVHGESPDFTIIMTLHISGLLARLNIRFDNRTSSETNDKLGIHNVNGSDESWELQDLLNFVASVAIDNVDSSVFASGVKGTVLPNDGTDKTALMETESLHASVAVPNVDE